MWPVIIIGLSLLAYKGYTSVQLIDQLQTNFSSISIIKKGTNVFSSALDIGIELINPTNGSVTVTSLAGSVFFDNSETAKFNYLKPFTIPASAEGGKVVIHVNAIVNNSTILLTLLSIITKSTTPAIKILLKTNAFGASFSNEIPLIAGQKLKLSSNG